MGKRANIRDTRRATETLVRHAQRDEFVARGLLPTAASVGDAQVAQRQMRRDEVARVKERNQDEADPKSQWLVGGGISAVFIAFAVLLASTVFWWITAIVVGACLFAALSSHGDAAAARQPGVQAGVPTVKGTTKFAGGTQRWWNN